MTFFIIQTIIKTKNIIVETQVDYLVIIAEKRQRALRGLCEESTETKSPNINSFRLDDTGDGRTIRDQLNSTNQAAEALLDQTISLVGLERLEQQRKEAQARSIIGLPPDPES